jgi:uncharacterized protein YlxW (UPF0749 family)
MPLIPPTPRPLPMAGPALHGPGLIVTLTDSKRRPSPSEDAYFFTVHDSDLNCLIVELSCAGAEGFSLNGRRLQFPGSGIRNIGRSILADGETLDGPYVLKAIGSPAELAGSIRMPNGFFDSMAMLTRSGGSVTLVSTNDLTVPALRSSGYRYARPVPDPHP